MMQQLRPEFRYPRISTFMHSTGKRMLSRRCRWGNVRPVIGKEEGTVYNVALFPLPSVTPMKSLSRRLIALCLFPVLAQAAPLSQITLPDGRQVQLNDDFTWEYLVVKPAEPVQGVAAEVNAGAVVTVAAPVLTDQAKANPALLSQMARDGVVVKLDKIEGADPLTLTFMVSNTGHRNVVGVRGWVTLFSTDGVQLSRQEARFWVAENRLPDTYLRKGQERPSLAVAIPRPAGLADMPLVRVEIEEVTFR